MGMRIEGLGNLRRKLGLLADEEKKAVRREIKRAAVNIQSATKRKMTEKIYSQPISPSGYKRTGRLRNSISHETEDDGMAARVGTNVEYAPFVEFGTRHMPARPTLFPAFEEERPKFVDRLKKAVEEANRKASRG